jgi:3-hydroxyacyl-CoA dehydrogenase
MGAGIAQAAANAGVRVLLHDASASAGCRFRKLHPFDSRSPANQNMIA